MKILLLQKYLGLIGSGWKKFGKTIEKRFWHLWFYSLPAIQQYTCGSTVQNQMKVYLSISNQSFFTKVKFIYLSEQWPVTNLTLY